ncbi:MAG: histidine--tRNA ligase [Myxococcota bacterium]|nr:histidine--tRNA ligase [Myxococcota bacterium]
MSKQSISTKPVKGMRDVFPADMRIRNWLFQHWRTVAKSFGFEEYDSAIVESEALYIRKAGDDITKELYTFEDKGGRKIALRPEMTPTLARMIMAKGGSLPLPARWFSIPQCFRYERMQKGRKREHFQWNMDIIGLSSVAAEVELMAAQYTFLKNVGFVVEGEKTEIGFKVSNRQIIETFLDSLGITGETFAEVCIVMDKRDKIGEAATIEQLSQRGLNSEQANAILNLLNIRGMDELRETVGEDNPGYRSLVELISLAEAMGIASVIEVDLSVIRGLSYYTGTVWELYDTSGSVPRAIAGGGRYDRLMESLGGKPTPMVGFGFGDVVITLLLQEKKKLPTNQTLVDDVIYPIQKEQFAIANRLAAQLRGQNRTVLVEYSERRFKHVIKLAEKVGAKRMLIIGESEAAKGVVRCKTIGGNQEEQPLSDFGL